jgi:hypothetical protein
MTKQRITRRQVLTSAGAAGGIAALASAAPALAAVASATTSLPASNIVGSWLATIQVTGKPNALSLLTFDTGGGIVETDSTDAVPPATGPGHGAWAPGPDGNTVFIQVRKFLLGSNNQAAEGFFEYAGPIEFTSEDAFTGSGMFQGVSFSGQVLFSGTYNIPTATRIKAEPL